MPESNEKKDRQQERDIPMLEWVIGIIGLLIVLAVIGYLVYEGLKQDKKLPQMEIEIITIEQVGEQYLVSFAVTNSGDFTAAAVSITGTLSSGGETLEESSTTLTYVPAGSTREAGLYFTQNPEEGDLEIRATGFEEP